MTGITQDLDAIALGRGHQETRESRRGAEGCSNSRIRVHLTGGDIETAVIRKVLQLTVLVKSDYRPHTRLLRAMFGILIFLLKIS